MFKDATFSPLAHDAADLREILDTSGIGLWEHDHATDYSIWSPAVWRMLGGDQDDLPTSTGGWFGRVHPEDQARLEAALAGADPLHDVTVRVRRQNGEWLWVRSRGRIIERDATGQPLRSAGTLIDFSEQERLEQALADRDERLQLVTDTITEVFYVSDAAIQRIFYVSPAYERIWQKPVDELYANARSFLDAVHPDDLPALLAELETHAAGKPFDQEYRIVRPDGSARWIWDRGFPVGDASGSVTRYVGLAQDITERKQAESEIRRLNAELEARVARRTAELEVSARELRNREQRYRTIVDTVQEGIWMIDAQARTSFTNARMADMLGYAGDEMLGRPLLDFMDEDWRGIAQDNLRRRADRISEQHDFKVRRKNGAALWVLISANPLYDAEGHYAGALATVTDITERKGAESLSRKLAAIIESSSDLIATASLSGAVDYMNRAGRSLLGIGATASLDQARIEDYHPPWAYRNVVEKGIPAALAQGQWMGDNAMLQCDGNEVPVSQLIIAQRDSETGQVGFLSTICRDMSEHRRTDGALRQLQQEQELILDSVPAMIFYKDTENRILRVNAAVARSLGLSKEAIEGKHSAAFYPEEADRYYQDDLSVIQTGQPRLGIEEPYRLPSGEERWLSTDKIPLKDHCGGVTGVLVMAADITARKHAEEALREADHRKDEFIATLAHELRNPLAPIKTASQLLQLPNVDEAKRAWCCAVIERQSEHLAHLVDDLLDLSRITRGKIGLNKELLSIADIAQRAIETSRPLIEARRHALTTHLPRVPLRVEGDVVRLAQVLSNLLNNAAKYTEPGGHIVLDVQRDNRQVVINVKDNGIGIPEPMLAKVFDMFAQVDRSLEKSHGGLGIGLSLAKQLVTLHGGSIAAYSGGHGMGSEFVVSLPISIEPVRELSPSRDDSAGYSSRHRVLIVDDNRDAARSLSMMLESVGHDVRMAGDGWEAVEVAGDFRPEFILMDIGMPKLNGYDACERIRAEPWGQGMAIVALTGWSQNEDKDRSRAAGFTHHLVKPVDLRELRQLLDALPEDPGRSAN